ncbi:GDP-mannose 4,6-dehydratase, partial [Patescibacteria group bacterium]
KVGETYCVGGMEVEVNNLQLVKKIIRIMGKSEALIKFVKDRPGHDRKYAVDWSKIKNDLGWQPQISLEEALEKTIIWYRRHQDWWQPALK